MFKRSKLREILIKNRTEISQEQPELHIDADESDENNKTEQPLGTVDGALSVSRLASSMGRTTPIEYFTYSEKDFNYVKPKEPLDYAKLDSFQRAVGPILILGQFFALLPVRNVLKSDPRHMRYSTVSVPMGITVFFLVASSMFTISFVKHLMNIGINAKNVVGFVFFSCVQASCILFLSLAKRWPRLMRFWMRTELIFMRKPYETPKRNLVTRIRVVAIIILLLSLLEHILYLASATYSQERKTLICAARRNQTGIFSFHTFIRDNYDYVFQTLPFTRSIGAYILIINFGCTFVWNYMDLFIVMVSQDIAYRFEQVTARINKLVDKEVPESVFMEIREHYVKLCELLESVDENLSSLILLSCCNNLYFVCYQLLNIFNKLRWPINYIYFWISLLYLIGRTAFVFLTAASINDQSRGGLSVLRRVPNKSWCVEVERLIFQMTTQTVALSGKKFYFITRRLLFGMAGTIVTYELVLLQFDEPNRSKGLPDICD